jgi:hypothetical protein
VDLNNRIRSLICHMSGYPSLADNLGSTSVAGDIGVTIGGFESLRGLPSTVASIAIFN